MADPTDKCSACKADLAKIDTGRSPDGRTFKRCASCGNVNYAAPAVEKPTGPPTPEPPPASSTPALQAPPPAPAPAPVPEPAAPPPPPAEPAAAPSPPAPPPPEEPQYAPHQDTPERKEGGAGLAIALVVGAAAVAAVAVGLAKKGGYQNKQPPG